MSQLDSRKRDRRVVDGFEPHHGCTASLDRTVVLLDDVVEVLAGSNFHFAPDWMLSPQAPQRAPTRHVTIDGDLPRSTWVRSELWSAKMPSLAFSCLGLSRMAPWAHDRSA